VLQSYLTLKKEEEERVAAAAVAAAIAAKGASSAAAKSMANILGTAICTIDSRADRLESRSAREQTDREVPPSGT
jgi:ribulose kinase